jgi:dephospho-CoA kinase
MHSNVIILTGNIGSGKSTVLRICERLGYGTVSTDEICHEILREDLGVREVIERRWGRGILDAKGGVDRRGIGRIVFGDERELIWLEDLLHPKIIEIREKRIAKSTALRLIVEIPLFFEKNACGKFKAVACVIADPFIRLQRTLQRGFSKEQFLFISKRQKTASEHIALSQFVLLNNGSIECLEQQVQHLLI